MTSSCLRVSVRPSRSGNSAWSGPPTRVEQLLRYPTSDPASFSGHVFTGHLGQRLQIGPELFFAVDAHHGGDHAGKSKHGREGQRRQAAPHFGCKPFKPVERRTNRRQIGGQAIGLQEEHALKKNTAGEDGDTCLPAPVEEAAVRQALVQCADRRLHQLYTTHAEGLLQLFRQIDRDADRANPSLCDQVA